MKTNIFAFITLVLFMIGGANAAPALNITGAATPWTANAENVVLSDLGTVQRGTGIFSELAGGSLTNLASVIDLNVVEGDYSASNTRVFDNFLAIDISGGLTSLVDTYFILQTVDDVIKSTTATGQTLIVDTKLKAIIDGVDEGSFDFRWELSHNGITGSFSVSTPILRDISPRPIDQVPLPAAAWLFGSSLLGLVGFTRRKASVT